MALKEETHYFVTILEDGQIQVREDRVIFDKDVELTRLHHRHVMEPGEDTSWCLSDRAKRIAAMEWTPEVISAYRQRKQAGAQ